MPRVRAIGICVALVVVTLGTAATCVQSDVPVGPREWDVLLRLPNAVAFQIAASPDGSLFATGDGGLYRADPPSYRTWSRVAATGALVTRLYAPADTLVFALTRTCGTVYRWTPAAGWQTQATPLSDSTWQTVDAVNCIHLLDLWGRSASDVYAVGQRGAILHFDGRSWGLEANPFVPAAGADTVQDDVLWGVTVADGGAYYASGAGRALRRSPGGQWSLLRTATGAALPAACGLNGVAAQLGGGALFAYGSCLSEVRDSVVMVRATRIPNLGTGIYAGQTQRDGSALFWSYEGAILDVRGGDMRVRRMAGIRAVGRVLALGSSLYVVGDQGSDGVVVRISRNP